LYPVWLPALFTLAKPNAGLRPVGRPDLDAKEGPPVRLLFSEGPGFSGSLDLPGPGAADSEFIERWREMAIALKIPPRRPPLWKQCSNGARQLWNAAPAPARGIAMGILVAAAVILVGSKLHIPKPSIELGPLSSGSFAAAVHERAMIDLQENFQAGLGAWSGTSGWEKSWVVSSSGSAQPGRLALFVPSNHLTDYRVELQGYIESKALGFVFRATDSANYYAVRIAIKKPGPLPSVVVVRYAVIDGHEEPKHEAPITFNLRDDTFYRILLTVEGEHFGVTVNDQLVDAWSDGRLKSGGIGLFGDKGEKASVRSVHLVENDDFLGKLCSQVSQWTADRRTIGAKHE